MAKTYSTPIQLPLAIEGDTIEIPLTKGFVTVVDAADGDLADYQWHTLLVRGRAYARRDKDAKRARLYLHREILSRIINRALTSDDFADHIDGDSLNNRRCNLRLTSRYTNQQNRGKASHNSTGYKGVGFDKRRGTWYAQIGANGQHYHLGSYATPEDAYDAYCKAARDLHGEFARLE